MRRSILSILLIGSCAVISSCATTNPDIYIKGVDYDEGVANNQPQNKATWMWITHDAAKRRLKWVTK
jgi:hypothetical protein